MCIADRTPGPDARARKFSLSLWSISVYLVKKPYWPRHAVGYASGGRDHPTVGNRPSQTLVLPDMSTRDTDFRQDGAVSTATPSRVSPDATSFNLTSFYRLCLYISRDLHLHLNKRIIQHPDIPREVVWSRLRNAYWQASIALAGRGDMLDGERQPGFDTVSDLPMLALRLAVAADAMQREIATTGWGQDLFPAPGPGDLGGKELRRLLLML